MADVTIDILAQLEGAESTDQILALANSLDVTDKAAGQFDAAIAKVQAQLDAATQAAQASSAELDNANSRYNQLEKAADKAAKAVERAAVKGKDTSELQTAADAAKAALAGQAAAVDAARDKATGAVAAQEQLAAALGKVEEAAQSSARAQQKAADDAAKAAEKEAQAAKKAADEERKAAEDAAKAANKQADDQKKAADQVDAKGQSAAMELLGEKAQKATKAMDVAAMVGPWGAAAIAVAAVALAFAALGAAVVSAMIKTAAFAVQTVDATEDMRDALRAAAGADGADLSAMVDRVSQKSPQATAEIAKLAESLYKSGKRGDELEKALTEASYEASGLGKNPGPEQLAAKMGRMSVLASSVEKNVAAIFGGTQLTKAVQEFEADLKSIVDMFSQSSQVGQALRSVVSAIFPSLLTSAHGAVPAVKTLITGMALGAVKAAIAFVQVKNAISGMFKGATVGDLNLMTVGMYTLAGVVALAATGVAVLGIVLAAIGAAAASVAAPFVLGAIAITALVSRVTAAKTSLMSLDFASVGSSVIDGLVNGIVSGTGKVIAAIKSLGTTMITAAMSSIDAHSPSKAFYRVGDFGVQGYEEALDDGKNRVDSAVKATFAPPSERELGGSPAASASGGQGGISITINIDGAGGNASAIGEEVEVRMRRFFSSLSIQAGAGVTA